MKSLRVIAIDGPAASGKSTVARLLAAELGFVWVSSGSLYRALTWWLTRGGDIPDDAQASKSLRLADFQCSTEGGDLRVRIGNLDPTKNLRDPAVNRAVSPVSQLPSVRNAVNSCLHRIAEQEACVIEGRDIGTCVFPAALAKFFIDASVEERARRRGAEGGQDCIADRDRMDSSRALAPLAVAPDAVVIDSTHLNPDEVVSRILTHLKNHPVL